MNGDPNDDVDVHLGDKGVHPNSHKHFIPYMGFCASIWDSVRGNSGYDDEDEDGDDRIDTLIKIMLVDMMVKMNPHLRWTLTSALYVLLKNQFSKTLSRLFPRQKRFHLEMTFVVFFLGGSLLKKEKAPII